MTSTYELDQASSLRMRLLYPDFARRLVRVYDEMFTLSGHKMVLQEGIRSWKKQAELYQQGRSLPGKVVTRATPGLSCHQYGCAADSIFFGIDPYLKAFPETERKSLWAAFGALCSKEGLTWGGDWNQNQLPDANDIDLDHCEITYGLKIQEMKDLYLKREKISTDGLSAVFEKFDKLRGVTPPSLGGADAQII